MKTFRLFSILLSFLMVFSLSTTAVFAGDCTDKVLDNTQKGKDIDNLSKNRLNTYKNLRNSYNKAAAAYFNNKEPEPQAGS